MITNSDYVFEIGSLSSDSEHPRQNRSVRKHRTEAEVGKQPIFIEDLIENLDAPDDEPHYISKKLLQDMSVSELRAMLYQSFTKAELKEKMLKTGLSKRTIQQIENNKEQATLQDIIIYCRSLNIDIQDFLPEVF